MKEEKDTIISFEEVSKRFRRGRKLLLKEALLDIFKPQTSGWFWALKDVGFKVKKGEALGVVGPNGSGKSTILKLIAGVMVPEEGVITTKGRIAPLIELGAGFHPELTGRENVYINGSILGMKKAEIDAKFDKIVRFAGIKKFIDTPVKHYSSGMYMRLGFSIAISVNPDILLIDEILAVGDVAFREKCMKKMEMFKKKGVAIVFVSHNLRAVESFCDKAIYLDSARIVEEGYPGKIIKMYRKSCKS